jgi:hypothetical protein
VPEDVSSIDGSGGNQDQTGPRSGTSADDEVKPDTERGPEEVAAEQYKVPGARTEARTDAETSSQQPPNWTIRFPKLDHLVSAVLG